MISSLADVVGAFTPLAFIAGLILASRPLRDGRRTSRSALAAVGAGLTAAVPVCALAARGGNLLAARVLLDAAAIVAAFAHAAAFLLPENRRIRAGAEVFFLAALAAASMVSFLSLMDERGISSFAVINTELLLNAGAVFFGACLIACLTPVTANAAPKSGNRVIVRCLLAASALVVVPRLADVLLGLMRLKAIEVTGGLLSFAAKTNMFAAAVPYLQLAMAAGLAAAYARRRSVFPAGELSMSSAQRRQALAVERSEARWVRGSAALVCAALAALLAHDLYAGRPEKITRPVRLEADARGFIRVKTASVADGDLHRFSYVTDDGHVVRFLLIKLEGLVKKSRIGVVYDACVMCGDKGYIQRKREVICLACNVRIFNPSIGKEGGCNPIPLKHAVEGEHVVIAAEELTRGAKHFSQVVSITVKDPVTGKELDSLKAPARHEYRGANYFFESEASQARFMASPEKYARKPLP
ncbi:MAG: DUF2318 domain-containing protein [Elusimicrobia bacterium]|nr:DUF2318 domain-containing protein [Elusimicrobiota bacterium]